MSRKYSTQFLLTYKLSQDHLETFFLLMRRKNGWNNNPTAKQFKDSYRKLLHFVNISVPLSANCIPQDNTILLQVSNEYVGNEQNVTEHSVQETVDASEDFVNLILTDHDYPEQTNRCLTEYAYEIITYISGYVAKVI